MFAMSTSNSCARDTHGTSAKFRTFANNFKDVNVQNEMSIFLDPLFWLTFSEKKISDALASSIQLPLSPSVSSWLLHVHVFFLFALYYNDQGQTGLAGEYARMMSSAQHSNLSKGDGKVTAWN